MTATVLLSIRILRYWIAAGNDPSQRPSALQWILPLAMFFPPVIENLTSGQKGAICLALFAGDSHLLLKDRPRAAGALFGLLLFKPQFTLVMIPFMLFGRQWRFLSGFAIMATA